MLRRPGNGGKESTAKQRKIYSMAGRDSFDWRKDFRLGFYRMKISVNQKWLCSENVILKVSKWGYHVL